MNENIERLISTVGEKDEGIKGILRWIERKPNDAGAYEDMTVLLYQHVKDGETKYHEYNRQFRAEIIHAMRRYDGSDLSVLERMNSAYKKSLLIDAKVSFDAYLQYVESNRDPKKRFYLPRREKLIRVVNLLQDLADDKYDIVGISLPPGVGKLLADDTPVMTKDGWKNHGDLVVGDYVVGLDGKYKRVERVFEKGYANYEVEFTNGEKVKCHENHEWLVYNRHKQKYETITTNKMIDGGISNGDKKHRGHRYHYMLPFCEPMLGEEKDLPVDPYVFGAWIGDGTTVKPAITICNDDTCIVDYVKEKYKLIHAYEQVGCKRYEFDGLRDDLGKIGLCQYKNANEKYIPEVYITASYQQRLHLLAGLIDTDGTKSREGRYAYTTTNKKILDAVCQLISTFGWRYCVVEYEPVVSSSGIVGKKTVYSITFCPTINIPCLVQRKRMTLLCQKRRIAIKSIKKIEPVQGNCIQVEDGMYRIGRTMLPTHNSTVSIFYLSWMAGKYPDEPMLAASHSNAFVRGVYDECLRIFDKNGEYLWNNVFPNVNVVNTNAKDLRIDLGKRKRFETLEFTSIGSGNAGLYRAGRLLYADDLIAGLEIALSRERLDKLWETYTTDLRQRKIGDHCKELHVSTHWSTADPVSRLERQYANDPRATFLAIPALDENDESNFDYKYGVGFTTAFYKEQREIMDDVSWRALYMNQPIEREGLLYAANELRRYFELPDREPDAIISVCDTKDRGTDYCVMPIAYQYGSDYYIEDVVCDNSNPEIVEPRLVEACIKHKVQMSRFESNSAGGRVAQSVQAEIKKRGGITKITTKYTTQNKETKIIMASPFCKEHFLFKDDSVTHNDKEYRRFMNFLCSYTMAGKNRWDDCADSIAMMVDYVQTFASSRVEVIQRPW